MEIFAIGFIGGVGKYFYDYLLEDKKIDFGEMVFLGVMGTITAGVLWLFLPEPNWITNLVGLERVEEITYTLAGWVGADIFKKLKDKVMR